MGSQVGGLRAGPDKGQRIGKGTMDRTLKEMSN